MIDRNNWREEIESRLIPEMREWGLTIWDGWRDLVCDLVDRIEAEGAKCILFQVKEKYAGLRFYLADTPESPVADWIEEAQKRSYSICERCGAPGSEVNSGGWIKTLCWACFKVWDEGCWSGVRSYLSDLGNIGH
jgi:hypothetical protein